MRRIPEARLVRTADEHRWEFANLEVTQLIIDPASFRFMAWSLEGQMEVRFESPFVLHSGDLTLRIDPTNTRSLSPLLNLIGVGLRSAQVTRSGHLTISFHDGTQLLAEADDHYESWEANGSGVLSEFGYLCTPKVGTPWG